MLKVYALAAATVFILAVCNTGDPVEASVSHYENRTAQLQMLMDEDNT